MKKTVHDGDDTRQPKARVWLNRPLTMEQPQSSSHNWRRGAQCWHHQEFAEHHLTKKVRPNKTLQCQPQRTRQQRLKTVPFRVETTAVATNASKCNENFLSSLNWLSSSTALFVAWHLSICLNYTFTASPTFHHKSAFGGLLQTTLSCLRQDSRVAPQWCFEVFYRGHFK